MSGVLARLGSPEQWIAEDEQRLQAVVVMAALSAPIAGFATWFIDEGGVDLLWRGHSLAAGLIAARFIGANIAVAAGAWWIVLSGLMALLMQPLKTLFAPLMDGLRRKHTLIVLSIGAISLGAGITPLMSS